MALFSEQQPPDEAVLLDDASYRFSRFSQLHDGQTMHLRIGDLTPSQKKDGTRSASSQAPISAYYDSQQKKIIIVDGNHRYYDLKPGNDWNRKVEVRKVSKPL